MPEYAAGRLAGTVAVITGGGTGIGEATARRLVGEGAKVVVGDIQQPPLDRLAQALGSACRTRLADVRAEPDVAMLVDLAVADFGRLDIMVNNAGVLGAVGPIATTAIEDVEATFAVNLRGVLLGVKHAARVMVPAGSGSIISMSSPAGLVGGLGPHAYSAAKAGVIGLTQSVAAELRPHGVRANAIVPGATVTAMTADAVVGDATDLAGASAAMAKTALMGRPIRPADIAAAVAFLASDEAAFITGETLRVDGGMTAAPGSSPFATGHYGQPGDFLEGGVRGCSPGSDS